MSTVGTIAIIEDSDVMQERLQEFYGAVSGIEVVGLSRTVRGAREIIAATRPSIVSLDLWLEDGSSFSLIHFLHQNYPRTTIIVLTQNATPFMCRKAATAGAAYVVDKAEAFNQLPNIVQACLDGR